MRKLLFLLCLISISVFSQEVESEDLSFYLSVDLSLQELNDPNYDDNSSIMVGATIGVLFNKNFIVACYGNINSQNKFNDDLNTYLRYSDGGLVFGFKFFKNSPIQIVAPVKLGMGNIRYYDNNWTIIENYNDIYYLIEPGVGIDFKIYKAFQLGLLCSYKMTTDINLIKTPNDIMTGLTATLSFKIVTP